MSTFMEKKGSVERKWYVVDAAGLPLRGVIPEDQKVILSAAFKQPLLDYTKKGAAAACKRIAKRLQGISVPVPHVLK